jgi:hypothetical protein
MLQSGLPCTEICGAHSGGGDEVDRGRSSKEGEIFKKIKKIWFFGKVFGLKIIGVLDFSGRLLKALGAPRRTRIYWAGGEPLGGQAALQPLLDEFTSALQQGKSGHNPGAWAFQEESVQPCSHWLPGNLSSDVFLQSHGGKVKGNNGLYYLYVVTNFFNHAYFLMRFIQHYICERLKCVCVESSCLP